MLRLEQIINGADHTACDRFTRPGDPNATALYYGAVPDFDATPEAVHDLTFCLGSPPA
ncbi:hypothetical protein O7599_08460 [Streptomyces sp. WMMC500]|uniref:hypothetical protein n=1 Tax=Streptomyces sp. WMMC500 TaxID=3015154 RepID=UPI00248C6514|nr:hypothetical protein [Streptomyces sp. WMMC500]WBB62551.1 hypothetical protein O7599_08460 [Streptomyces sp. WMMC500]